MPQAYLQAEGTSCSMWGETERWSGGRSVGVELERQDWRRTKWNLKKGRTGKEGGVRIVEKSVGVKNREIDEEEDMKLGFKGLAFQNPSQIHCSHSNLRRGTVGTHTLLIYWSAANRGMRQESPETFGGQFFSLSGAARTKLCGWEPI